MDRFPLPARAKYSYERSFRLGGHQGCDIFAPRHTPALAVENGVAWASVEPKGGNVVYLLGDSGTRYFYAHLESWSDPALLTSSAAKPVRVEAGWDLGLVGTTGNADGRAPHLHFQIRHGSETVDPFDDLFAVDPKHLGTIPEPGVMDRFGGEVSKFGSDVLNGIGMLALLWVLVNASKGR